MQDDECVQFLQWAVPQLHMRWPGFRKVRRQVCKRLQRRINQLGLDEAVDYRNYLVQHNEEWQTLDILCRVTISRFYRDKQMFAFLEHTVLPTLAQRVMTRGDDCLRVWSVGAGSGEEPYTVAIIWKLMLQEQYQDIRLEIIATDADLNLIQRSQMACYEYGSVKNLPHTWREEVFEQKDERYCLKQEYRGDCQFLIHDVRQPFLRELSERKFDLILCRNLVFTYFDQPLQQQMFTRFMQVLEKGGALVIGIHEKLPDKIENIEVWSERLCIFEKL